MSVRSRRNDRNDRNERYEMDQEDHHHSIRGEEMEEERMERLKKKVIFDILNRRQKQKLEAEGKLRHEKRRRQTLIDRDSAQTWYLKQLEIDPHDKPDIIVGPDGNLHWIRTRLVDPNDPHGGHDDGDDDDDHDANEDDEERSGDGETPMYENFDDDDLIGHLNQMYHKKKKNEDRPSEGSHGKRLRGNGGNEGNGGNGGNGGWRPLLEPVFPSFGYGNLFTRPKVPRGMEQSSWVGKPKGRGTRPLKSGSGCFEMMFINATDHSYHKIGGYGEVKKELMQLEDLLQRYEKYEKWNVRIPRGVIFYGPPGNGKTLMTKCFAGETGIPLISTSGSEFQEKYVGTGPARVRELFEFASENSPCIVFIDEIDALARARGSDSESSTAERDSTLNQLLVELDGMKEHRNVLVMASTNRIDILDPALLRPGRFDKKIMVGTPDTEARKKILEIHLREKPIHLSDDDQSRVRCDPRTLRCRDRTSSQRSLPLRHT